MGYDLGMPRHPLEETTELLDAELKYLDEKLAWQKSIVYPDGWNGLAISRFGYTDDGYPKEDPTRMRPHDRSDELCIQCWRDFKQPLYPTTWEYAYKIGLCTVCSILNQVERVRREDF